MGKTDAFCVGYLSSDDKQKIKTNTILNDLDPVWKFES
jgi:hypothetical protein